ncbi:hypothetical protein Kpol_392p6 [Vanderwaltozyma polyspora DSM 70294]|uniref:Uncharacterized protein n=1 Tax=Vanderwaltozyma polyspora (strain ATCC 22028 / DSM 70294 / BCRC 21397 / CBS 2163 / NBRC 10782 / NRRL Y-8283 / UCD 57-17) TaxID=436907 RepID=A7TRR7_VANPO|nr:uncharacterized protein Kpol_392p6 [Vanderwaltozyma polyspora DSM 70294]EDO15039.1 hypothetical protein Kpol_392p6 [Vanderwaltozyma polyspora DSM 70294]
MRINTRSVQKSKSLKEKNGAVGIVPNLTELKKSRSKSKDKSKIDDEEPAISLPRSHLKELVLPEIKNLDELISESGLNKELFNRGHQDLAKFQSTINGYLSQRIYDLILTDKLTPKKVSREKVKWANKSNEKYYFLKNRYYVSDKGTTVRDRRNDDKILCPPNKVLEVVLCTHLINEHAAHKSVHRNLHKRYANISRTITRISLLYCSFCNPSEHVKPLKKSKKNEVYEGLLPFERIHIEIFKPFGDEKLIEGTYSHILYIRDYYSRYVWLYPLKKTAFKELTQTLVTYFFTITKTPIYIESSTINRNDLIAMVQKIALKYDLRIGIGIGNSSYFHYNGLETMKQLLLLHEDECLGDWGMCLKYGKNLHNNLKNRKVLGMPINLLLNSGISECSIKYKSKKNTVIDETFPHNMIVLDNGKSEIYLEDNLTSTPVIDEKNIEPVGYEYYENPINTLTN